MLKVHFYIYWAYFWSYSEKFLPVYVLNLIEITGLLINHIFKYWYDLRYMKESSVTNVKQYLIASSEEKCIESLP